MQYGNGEFEKNLGRVLHNLKASDVVVGTKVRLLSAEFGRIEAAVATSLEGSLARLRRDCVDIFHLHNAITEAGGEEALSVQQVVDDIVPAFERLRHQGKARFLGLTAIGDTMALHQVIDACVFDIEIPTARGVGPWSAIRVLRVLARHSRRIGRLMTAENGGSS